MSLRKYISDEPAKALDKLIDAFIGRYKDLLGDTEDITWSKSIKASDQILIWARHIGLVTDEQKRDLEILVANAARLVTRDGKSK